MFEHIAKDFEASRQGMLISGLRMFKEMCPIDDPNKCAQAREAQFVMENLYTAYQDFERSNCGHTIAGFTKNIKLYNKNSKQVRMYGKALAPYLRGEEESRLEALTHGVFITVDGVKLPLNAAAKNYNDLRERLADIMEQIVEIEKTLSNKKYIMYQCHKHLKEIYDRFKVDQAAQQKLKEKKPEQKRITVFIDNSWPLSPREIQHAIDVLKAFKPEGEDGLGFKSAAEALESFKKSVEKDIEKKTTVKQEGLFFKLSTAE